MKRPTLEDAIALARTAHEGQVDKAGEDYILHLLRVMERVNGNDAKIVAVLHDAIEDTDDTTTINVTAEHLRKCGYPAHIIEALEAVTKRPDEEGSGEGYERFIQRAGEIPLSRQVKIADLRDNMDLSRIANPSAKDHNRVEKYQRALDSLENSLPS